MCGAYVRIEFCSNVTRSLIVLDAEATQYTINIMGMVLLLQILHHGNPGLLHEQQLGT